jgi:hypothetical protein
MSINPNQTNVNPLTSFFTLAGGGGGGGVTSISAGSNITAITGTSSVPIINAIGAVASISAGSGITIGGTANIPIISATAGTPNATSYTNPNTPVLSIPALQPGDSPNVGFINPALYNNSNVLYRLSINYEYASATFATTPSGNLTLSLLLPYSPNPLIIANHSVPFTASLPDGNKNIGGHLTCVFRGLAIGAGLFLIMLNSTNVALTNASIVFTNFAVEEITSSFTLLTSSGQVLNPPP